MAKRLFLLATAPRGTESLLAQELETLGATKIRQDRGGVRFAANLREALGVALWSRLSMRLLLPIGEATVRGAEGLYDAVFALPWEEHLTATSTFAVEATLKDSEHVHSGFVALKVKDAIADRLRAKLGKRPNVDTHSPTVRVVTHLSKERLSVSLDLCGEPLNRRGYRVRPTIAPLKETLAAAMLAATGYTGDEPLADPMCGSGTLLIEAGLIATRRAPGRARRFAVEGWPHLGTQAAEILRELKSDARARERPAPCPIFGFDKDDEAIEAARRNVAAARLGREIALAQGDAVSLAAPVERGLLISNPPYGDRLNEGGQKGMKTFYFKLGDNLARWQGWRMALLAGNPAFESAFHSRPQARHELWNGPIACSLLTYRARG